jgi:hypothetical protein
MRSSNNVNEATYISYASSANSNDFLIMDSKWQSHQQNVIAHIGGLLIIDTATTINNIIWNHIAITWQSSSGVVQIFKDGSVDYSSEFPAGSVITTGGSLVIGQEQDFVGGGFDRNQAFIGEIDEVRIWNIARTQQETQITMRSSLTGQEEGLVGYWNFDDDSARDISPQGNHGEFIGDAKVVESDLVLEPIYVTPINLEPFTLNDIFSLDLLSAASSELYSFAFDLGFDPEILKATGIDYGLLLSNSEVDATTCSTPTIDNAIGQITNVTCRRNTADGITGSGVLVTVNFEAVGVGRSPITIEKATFLDPKDQPIESATGNSQITVYGPHAKITGRITGAQGQAVPEVKVVVLSGRSTNRYQWSNGFKRKLYDRQFDLSRSGDGQSDQTGADADPAYRGRHSDW